MLLRTLSNCGLPIVWPFDVRQGGQPYVVWLQLSPRQQIGHKLQRDHAWSALSKHEGGWDPGPLKPVIPPVLDSLPHVFFRILVERCLAGKQVDRLRHA